MIVASFRILIICIHSAQSSTTQWPCQRTRWKKHVKRKGESLAGSGWRRLAGGAAATKTVWKVTGIVYSQMPAGSGIWWLYVSICGFVERWQFYLWISHFVSPYAWQNQLSWTIIILHCTTFSRSFKVFYCLIFVCKKIFILIHNTHTHTHPFNGPLYWTTQVSRYQKSKTKSGFYWSKRQWVAVASAGPYASLHLASDR